MPDPTKWMSRYQRNCKVGAENDNDKGLELLVPATCRAVDIEERRT